MKKQAMKTRSAVMRLITNQRRQVIAWLIPAARVSADFLWKTEYRVARKARWGLIARSALFNRIRIRPRRFFILFFRLSYFFFFFWTKEFNRRTFIGEVFIIPDETQRSGVYHQERATFFEVDTPLREENPAEDSPSGGISFDVNSKDYSLRSEIIKMFESKKDM